MRVHVWVVGCLGGGLNQVLSRVSYKCLPAALALTHLGAHVVFSASPGFPFCSPGSLNLPVLTSG